MSGNSQRKNQLKKVVIVSGDFFLGCIYGAYPGCHLEHLDVWIVQIVHISYIYHSVCDYK